MFVGLKGAEWPDSLSEEKKEYRQRFRADVYEALTRISASGYWYFPDTDEFTQVTLENDSLKKIPLPSVTLKDLLDQRRGFAQQGGNEYRDELTKAIDHSPNPLAAFQTVIASQRLGPSWHKYKSKDLMAKIEAWAKEKKIEVRPEWIESDQLRENNQSPQQFLAHFATFMTDDEIRSISVPFRAVEAMYRKINEPTKKSS